MSEETRVLLIFIDGLGIANRIAANPLSVVPEVDPLAHFRDEPSVIFYDGVRKDTDPRLGVDGRPQSASGQTTILTGVNAPKTLGYHKQGFPNQALRDVIAEHSVFLQLKRIGIESTLFANAYTPRFFEAVPRWKSASTCAVEAAEIQFLKLPDLLGGHAVYHDFTNRFVRNQGYDAPLLTPEEAAANLASIAARHRFTMYEHFITDKIGHDQDFEKAQVHLPMLAAFVRETVRLCDLEKTTVILTSDHGNVEDLTVRNHTLNDVPTIIWGRKNADAASEISDLTHITPMVLKLLTE